MMMRNLLKFVSSSVFLLAFVLVTLLINLISNTAIQKQLIESSEYTSRQLAKVIFRQPMEGTKKDTPVTEGPSVAALNIKQEHAHCYDSDWEHLKFETLTAEQLIEYFLWTNRTSCRIVNDFGGALLGRKTHVAYDAHKAICLDRRVAPVYENCLVYSFGINYDWSFDKEMELYGCNVFSFDPSMNMTNQTRSDFIAFYQMGLSDRDRWDDPRWPNVPMLTLNTFYKLFEPLHGDVMIDYLKLDVESAEWTVIPQLLRTKMIDKVRQLSIEFHIPSDVTLERLRSMAETVRSLENYGMIRFDCKPNLFSVANMTQLGLKAFDGYEIAFYNWKHVRHDVEIDSYL